MHALAGFTVVVTRPTRQQDGLVQQLRAQGADVTAIPLLAIDTITDAAQQQCIEQLLDSLHAQQIAIFISQNAAEQAVQVLRTRGQQWPATIQAFAVGSATAAFLADCGIVATAPARMDSEGLLALPELQSVDGKHCLIFRGQGGRETLAQTLRTRGAHVEYCELYRRSLPDTAKHQWQAWLQTHRDTPALICINSVETLRHLTTVDKAAPNRDNLALVVPGERVARAAREAGFACIVIADDARDSSILHVILQRSLQRSSHPNEVPSPTK